MDLQERYDELDNIISTLRILIDEVKDNDYKEQLQLIQFQAENELIEVDMEDKKITDLTDDELIKEFIFCNKMKKHWNIRTDEVIKEIERRDTNGNV